MIKQSTCEKCHRNFSYNSNDRKGRFCSQPCHYASKNETIKCIECKNEFIKRKKDMRKSCSTECFEKKRKKKMTVARKSPKKDPVIQENSTPILPSEPEINHSDPEYTNTFQKILEKVKEYFFLSAR